jgi:hypothetical protein
MKTKISLDTEFTGLHADSTLISIALVSECGKQFYAEFTDYNKEQAGRMGCKGEVFSNLLYTDQDDFHLCESYYSFLKGDTKAIVTALNLWFSQFNSIEIFGDCMSWDWVLFCDLFGGAFSIPQNVYYIPFDLANLFKIKNIDPDISRIEYVGEIDFEYKAHNALTDAKIVLACISKLAI